MKYVEGLHYPKELILPEYEPGTSIERDLANGLVYPLSKKCSREHASATLDFEIAYGSNSFAKYSNEYHEAAFWMGEDRFINKIDGTVLKQWRSEYLKNLSGR